MGAHVVKLEPYRWPPDIADQINEEWFNDSPNRRVFGEWRMGWVVLWSLDDSSLELELIRMFEARVRELVTR